MDSLIQEAISSHPPDQTTTLQQPEPTMAQIFLFGGPNGAGKTTVALPICRDLLQLPEYVNADAIAAGLSPFRPDAVKAQAARLMLARVKQLFALGESFCFESTLSSLSFAPFLRDTQRDGYSVNLIYLWLRSPELALERVRYRASIGGHDIPAEAVYRRYVRSVRNFFRLYSPLADNWWLYDNSDREPVLVARHAKTLDSEPEILNPLAWETLLQYEKDRTQIF